MASDSYFGNSIKLAFINGLNEVKSLQRAGNKTQLILI